MIPEIIPLTPPFSKGAIGSLFDGWGKSVPSFSKWEIMFPPLEKGGKGGFEKGTKFLDSSYYLMFNDYQQRRGEPLQIFVVRKLKAFGFDIEIRPCRPETRW